MRTKSLAVKATALAGSAALLAMGVPVFADTSSPDGPSFGDIDTGRTGSITIFKHEYQTNAPAQAGAPTDKTDTLAGASAPVQGVEFTAYPFANLPLAGNADANANWARLTALTEEPGATNLAAACTADGPKLEGFTFEAGKSFNATGEDGKTSLAPLPLGAYLVCETNAPAAVVSKAAPFIVTLPYPDNTREGKTNKWLYDVTVYPKNRVGEKPSKTIDEQSNHGYGLGSEVHFPVTAPVPTINDNENFDFFIVEDELDTRFGDLKVASVVLDGTTLTKDVDYTVTITGQKVDVSLTQAGLRTAKTKAGKNLVVTFAGTVKSLGADGIIPNQAKVYHQASPQDEPPTTPPTTPPPNVPPNETEIVKDYWGDARILKRDGGDKTTGLKGATFQVYAAEQPYADTCEGAVKTGNPISVNGQTEFVSGDNGLVTIAGLFVSDSVHETRDAKQRCYVLVETKAPEGYVLPAKAETPLTVKVGTTAAETYDVQIDNDKPIIPGLPLTGASGKMILTLVGAALILGGAGSFMVLRRRQAA